MADRANPIPHVADAAAIVPDGGFMVSVGPFSRQVAEAAFNQGTPFDLWIRGAVHRLRPLLVGAGTFGKVLSSSRSCEMSPTELAARAYRGRVDVHFITARVNVWGQIQASVQPDGTWTGALATADVLEYVGRPVVICNDVEAGQAWRNCTYDFRDRWRSDPAAELTVLTSLGLSVLTSPPCSR